MADDLHRILNMSDADLHRMAIDAADVAFANVQVRGVGLAERYGTGRLLNRPTTSDGHVWVKWDDESIGNDGVLLMDVDLLAD